VAKQSREEFVSHGNLGERSFVVRQGDIVKVEAELSGAAYSYLIHFLPNGSDEVRRDPDWTLDSRSPDDPRMSYVLTDTGFHAFALVVSRAPLPPYAEWKEHIGKPPWRERLSGAPGVVWASDGWGLDLLSANERSDTSIPGEMIRNPGDVVRNVAIWLGRWRGIDAVKVKAFPVLPAGGH